MNSTAFSSGTDVLVTVTDVFDEMRVDMSSVDILYVTMTCIMSSMSILGSLVILFVHWMYTDLRTAGRNMLAHLTVADLLTALGNLFGVTWYLTVDELADKMPYCKFHSALTIMSSIASFMWTVVIAWFIFWMLLRTHPPRTDQRRTGYGSMALCLVCWGVPIVIAVTALCLDVLGYDEHLPQASWCWIDPTTDMAFMWMLVTGKAWEFAACLLTVTLYTAVKILLFKQSRRRQSLHCHNRKVEEANAKLTFVPLVFIVIRIWGTIRFLLGNYAHTYASSTGAAWIVILQGTGDSAQGFANFVIYCFTTTKIRRRLLRRCTCLPGKPDRAHTHAQHSSASVKEGRVMEKRESESNGEVVNRCTLLRISHRVLPVCSGNSIKEEPAIPVSYTEASKHFNGINNYC